MEDAAGAIAFGIIFVLASKIMIVDPERSAIAIKDFVTVRF